MTTLREVADPKHIVQDDEDIDWVRVPLTEQSSYYNSDSEEVMYVSNRRSILRDFENDDDVAELDDAIVFRADADRDDLVEVYDGLVNYPFYDEDDHSQLEMEYQDRAWLGHYVDDFVRLLQEEHEEWADYLEQLDTREEAVAWALYEPLSEAMDAEGYYWEWDSEPILPDFERMVREEVDIGVVVAKTARLQFAQIEDARRKELNALMFGPPNEWEMASSQLMFILQLLVDMGVAAQAFGRPVGFLDLYSDEADAAQARNTAADAAGIYINDETDMPPIAARVEENMEVFQRLLHRWMAAVIALDSLDYMTQTFEEGEVPQDPVFAKTTLEERIQFEYARWAPTLEADYPVELPPTWVDERYWQSLEPEQLTFNFAGLGGYDFFGWQYAETANEEASTLDGVPIKPTEGYYLRKSTEQETHSIFYGPMSEDEARIAVILMFDGAQLTGEQMGDWYNLTGYPPGLAIQYLTSGEIEYLLDGSEMSGEFRSYRRMRGRIHPMWKSTYDDPEAWLYSAKDYYLR